MPSGPGQTRTVLTATLALWLASTLAFGLGLLIPSTEPLPGWIYGWLVLLPMTGIPLSYVIYRYSAHWIDLPVWRRWARLSALLVMVALLQATIDHLLFMQAQSWFGQRSVITPYGLFQGIAFNFIIYIWLFGLYAAVVELLAATARANRNGRAAAEARAEARDAQLELLRGQLNPHFLFNTLNNLSSLVLSGRTGEADEMIGHLARFLRRSLDQGGQDATILANEIAFMRTYIEIEAVRFPNRLTLEVDCPPGLLKAMTPSLLLQPLIEGAVRCIAGPSHGQAVLYLSARDDGSNLIIVLSGRKPCEPGDTCEILDEIAQGVATVRARLGLLFKDARIGLGHGEEGGFDVELSLPLEFDWDALE